MNTTTLIITNSSLAHMEEAQSFHDSILKSKSSALLVVADGGQHRVRSFGLAKVLNNINLLRIISLIKTIKTHNISRVIIVAPIPLLIFLMPYLHLKSIQVFYTLHEPPISNRNDFYYMASNIFHSVFLRFVDILLFYSEYAKSSFLTSGTNFHGKIFTLPLYKYREVLLKPRMESSRETISFIGNMGSNKNLGYVIDIAERLPNIQFLIAGNGDISFYKDKIRQLKNITLENRFLSEEEYYSYLDKSLFVLLPYSTASQSGVMLDAMCRGSIPVVAKTGSFCEFLAHGENGFIFNYESYCDDFVGMFENITEAEVENISNNSLKYYNEHFSLKVFHRRFSEILRLS